MSKTLSSYTGLGLVIILALALFGCSGGNTTPAEQKTTTLTAQSFSEGCALCHRSGSIADIAVAHAGTTTGNKGEITGVTIDDATGAVTINFKLFDGTNKLIPIAGVSSADIRFTIAKLVPGSDSINSWQSYLNITESKDAGEPGNAPDGTPTPDGTKATQATSERANTRGGTFTDNGNGTYSYKLSINIQNVTTPAAVSYESDRTHRVAMQFTGNLENAFLDFVPAGGALPATRDMVTNTSCNDCHIKLGLHGGSRIQVEYCVTCHNPGTSDANSGNTVDFKVMIHKIHSGEESPEVAAGGEYAIWGNQNSKNDYSTVVHPQDRRNCTKCHNGANTATPDGDNWKNKPSTAACTACHNAPDATEFPTFPNLTATQIQEAHAISTQTAGTRFKYNILGVTSTQPGQFPVVRFSVTDPANGNSVYNILTDPAFTSRTGGASRLGILIGWDTTDYTNTGSGSKPAGPVAINPLSIGSTPAADNGDGTFTVTSSVAIPADATGSGVVAIEGHPAGDVDGDGTYSDRIPVTSAVVNFPITDTVAKSRRTVVSIANCNKCHGMLSLHGNNRTDEPQVCVICHNADATDINRRPGAGTTKADGKVEEAIDFKYMIHAIHAGDKDAEGFREKGLVVYGFGNSANDYSEVRLPARENNLRNCAGCHSGTSYAVPLSSGVLPTTILTGSNTADPGDDTNITPIASACSSCHDSVDSKTHMSEQGGQFDFVAFAETESATTGEETTLCGPGPVSSQPAGHSGRTDCCSCHSVK